MSAGTQIRAYGTMRGWWATAVRVLSFVLVLALIAPGAIPSAEAQPTGNEPSLTASPNATTPDQPDGCPACHATCGCHQAIYAEGSNLVPNVATGQPVYATSDAPVCSVSTDRLPRPPRA